MTESFNPDKRRAIIPGSIIARAARKPEDGGLTDAQFRVMVGLLLCYNWDAGEAYPKLETLASLTGLTVDTVSASRARMAKKGYFTEEWRKVKSGGKSWRATFDRFGNLLPKAGGSAANLPAKSVQSSRSSLIKAPGLTGSNLPPNAGTLPTTGTQPERAEQSQEQSQGTESSTNGDPFALLKNCERINGTNGDQGREAIKSAWLEFKASPAFKATKLPAPALWDHVIRLLTAYHDRTQEAGAYCAQGPCIDEPARLIRAMMQAKVPLAYFEKCVCESAGKLEDTLMKAKQHRLLNSGAGATDLEGIEHTARITSAAAAIPKKYVSK